MQELLSKTFALALVLGACTSGPDQSAPTLSEANDGDAGNDASESSENDDDAAHGSAADGGDGQDVGDDDSNGSEADDDPEPSGMSPDSDDDVSSADDDGPNDADDDDSNAEVPSGPGGSDVGGSGGTDDGGSGGSDVGGSGGSDDGGFGGTASGGGAGTAVGEGGSGVSGAAGSGNSEWVELVHLTTGVSYDDAAVYDFGEIEVGLPDPSRSLFIVVQSASNDIVSAERVLVNGVAATKLVSVGEDVEPSAPSALFAIPFPTDYFADVEVELSTTVVRCAVSLFRAYGLENPTAVDDSEALTATPTGTLAVDVAEGGYVIGALAMAVDGAEPNATMSGIEASGYMEVLEEGTPTLMYAAVSSPLGPGSFSTEVTTADSTYNFRAFVASVH